MKKIIFLSLILLVLAASGCLDRAATPAATSVPPVNVTGTPSPVSPGPTVETKPPATPPQPAPTTTAGPSPRTPAATRTPRPTPGKADIQVQNMDTETDFPQTITFSLKARSPVNITRIAIRYSTDRITVAPVISEAVVNFQPAGTADVRWVWDMRKGGIPVGAKIKYQWVLTDDKGGRLTTEMNELTYIDPRFTGKSSLSWGDVNIYWYDGSLRFGQTLMDAAQGALEKLTQNTGATLERPANIYIYSGTQDLQSSLVFPQEWTGGVAFTDYSIVVIGISPDNQSLAWGKR
ncbi:MAG: peptidase MA family metallohydrolase, partial [Dehalococcoidia bacterium]|nr:peptidase MA family metallohydrolase [Dehalococcoidia bacterium]